MAEIRVIEQTANLGGKLIPVFDPGTLVGGENMAHKYVISAVRGGVPVSLSGTVSGVCLRFADGASIAIPGSIESGKATITLPAACYALDGRVRITIYVTADGATVAVWSCDTTVRLAETDRAVDPGTVMPGIATLIADIDEAVASIPPDYSDLSNSVYQYNNEILWHACDLSDTTQFEVTKYSGRYCNVGNSGIEATPRNIQLISNANYDAYCFIPANDVVIYGTGADVAYYTMAYLTEPTGPWEDHSGRLDKYGQTSVRYQKSDNNLPTASNPLSVAAGTQVVISVTANATPVIYVQEVIVHKAFRMDNLRGYNPLMDVEMHSGGGSEYIYYYVKTDSGKYLRHKLNHWISTGSGGNNGSGWVLRNVDLVSEDKTTVIFPVVTTGEWEMAVKIDGRTDFIGCMNHGSEISTIADLYFDGLKMAITDGASFQCSEIKANQKSTMYDPADETTVVGYHYKTHIITADGIRIEQRIEWVHDETMAASYVMMMPAVRGSDDVSSVQVTDRAYDDWNMAESNVATTTFSPVSIGGQIYRGHTLCLYGTTSGVVIESSCEIKDEPAGVFAYLHNAQLYNKWYYAYCGDGYAVHDEDEWEWVSRYKIRYNGE